MRCPEDLEASHYSQLISMLAGSSTWELTMGGVGDICGFSQERKAHAWQSPVGTLSLGFGLHLGKVELDPGNSLSWNSRSWALICASVSSSVKWG